MEWAPLSILTVLFSAILGILWRRQNNFRDNALAHIEAAIEGLRQDITDLKVDIATIQGDIKRLESWHDGKGEA